MLRRSAAYYHAALGAGLGGPFAHWVRLRLAWWEKRQERWEVACALWEAATRAEAFDPRPWEELAKFHEHRLRDVAAAHGLVRTALDLAQSTRASRRVVEAFVYRLGRLQRRLADGRHGGFEMGASTWPPSPPRSIVRQCPGASERPGRTGLPTTL